MGITISYYDEERLEGFRAELHRVNAQIQDVINTPARNAAEEEIKRYKLHLLNHRFETLNTDNYDVDCEGRSVSLGMDVEKKNH